MQTSQKGTMLRTKFIGADDLRRELRTLLENFDSDKDKIVVTHHGKPKAILLDINSYLELIDIQEDVIQPGYISSLYDELEKVKGGKGTRHADLVKKLKLNV